MRTIVGFHQDEVGDWVAELSCLHNQHVRHRPPFQERPWVLDPDGRRERMGGPLDCPLCDRAEMPADLALLRVAGPWDAANLPTGLRRTHRTARGVWGLLTVITGEAGLRLRTSPVIERRVAAGHTQAIPPETPHDLTLDGPVELKIEFWGRAEPGGPAEVIRTF